MVDSDLIQRLRTRERERERERERQRSSAALRRSSRERDSRRTLSYDAPPFYMPTDASSNTSSNPEPPTDGSIDTTMQYRRQLGERLYPRVRNLQPVCTGSLCRIIICISNKKYTVFYKKEHLKIT